MNTNPTEMFLRRAAEFPQTIAVLSDDITLNFRQLSHIVLSFSENMRVRGVRRGSIVSCHSNDSLVIIGSAFACALIGASWVYGDDALERCVHISPTHMLCSNDRVSDAGRGTQLFVDDSWLSLPGNGKPVGSGFFEGIGSQSDTWLYFHSSGTTGAAKFMELSFETQLKRFLALKDEFIAGESRCVFLFSPPSPPSLMRSLAALCWGAGLVMSTDPHFWIESHVTHVFASPQQIKYIMSGQRFSKKIGKALIGGDGLPDELSKDLLANFERVVNTYGSTETNLVVENEKLLQEDARIASRTIWFDSVIEIVDQEDQPVPANEEGIVRIRNDYTVSRYVGVESSRQSAFRDGWFYPGDKGILTKEGNFVVTGRLNDRLIIGGVKINAVLLDYIVNSVEGVEDAITFQLDDDSGENELVAFVKLRPEAIKPDVTAAIKVKIASSLGITAIPSKFIFTGEIPRTLNGKPDRRACAQLAIQARRKRSRGFV